MGDFLSNIVELKDFVKRGQEKCGEIRGGGCMYFEFWGIWQKLINFGMGLCFNIAPRQERYLIYKKEGRLYDVSIHAPKRERHVWLFRLQDPLRFNPRSQAGATR